jgi:valyl-tRNA synthetase
MPFVTECIWAELPHRATDPELLIVARWPAAADRDEATEAAVSAIIDLVRAIRNARAEARIEPAAWLPVDVYVPADVGDTLEGIRTAVERLARARPLRRLVTASAVSAAAGPGTLSVVAGECEATIHPQTAGDGGLDDRERARLERELADTVRLLVAARARLANDAFTAKAPPDIVAGARTRESELADRVERLRARLG